MDTETQELDLYDYIKKDPYPITLKNFPKFIDGSFDYAKGGHRSLVLYNENADIGGGRITERDIDVLKKYPYLHTVTVAGLHQDTFEYFIRKYGEQLRAIRFFKNKLVEDWSLLGTLRGLEFIYWFHNQRVERLWDMSGNRALKGLALDDFSRLHDLSGVERAPTLKYFHIGDKVWPKTVIDSLAPLRGTAISTLAFEGRKITDVDLSVLWDMPYLTEFNFFSNHFTTEQVAWMVANKPKMKGRYLCGMTETTKFVDGREVPAVLIVGKGKPLLARAGNETRIRKYAVAFDDMVARYRDVPYGEAFPTA